MAAGVTAASGMTATSGMNTSNGNYATNNAAGPQALSSHNIQANSEARHLSRSGKIEKAFGNLLCSTTLKQKGLQKQAAGQSMRQQAVHVAAAENLEAEAAMHRGHAAGLNANVVGGGAVPQMGQTALTGARV